MSFIKLSSLLLEARNPTKTPKGCKSGTAKETTKASYDTYALKSGYLTWTESEDLKVYYYYCESVTSNNQDNQNNQNNQNNQQQVATDKCPSDEGYDNKEFQEWVWKNHLGKTESDEVTTRLCGVKSDKTAKTCKYTVAVGTGCGDGTKSVWKELKNKFIEFKKGNAQPIVSVDPIEQKKKDCESKGQVYDASTGLCVPAKQEVDPDVQKLIDEMDEYRTILNSFYDSTGWIKLDTLAPNEYTPNFLSLKALTQITEQIIQLMEQKGASSDFGSFVELMTSLKEAYNVEKYKELFQKKFDPNGSDVFTSIDGLINQINIEAGKIKSSLGFDPLKSPTEKQVRDIIFRGQLRSVYKSGKINLMMMVYTYVGSEPLEMDNKGAYSEIEGYYNTVKKDRNFNNCKNILDVYRQTYEDGVYDQSLLSKVKKEIQQCWCSKQYEDLGKLGTKNMFDKEMRKDRKTLIQFLNQLPSEVMGDFSIRLNSSVCGGIKLGK